MPRLFVAVDLPEDAVAELIRLQPAPLRGVSLSDPSQMHLTLHFLGEAEIETTRVALQPIELPAFHLTLDGIGYFPSRDGSIVWVGVQKSQPLYALHAAVSAALVPVGYQPEQRPYQPHITLARCKNRAAAAQIKHVLSGQCGFLLADQPITTFGMYSSTYDGQKHVYRCEQSYRLT